MLNIRACVIECNEETAKIEKIAQHLRGAMILMGDFQFLILKPVFFFSIIDSLLSSTFFQERQEKADKKPSKEQKAKSAVPPVEVYLFICLCLVAFFFSFPKAIQTSS